MIGEGKNILPTPFIPYGYKEYKSIPQGQYLQRSNFLEPFSNERKVKPEGQQSLFNPKIWWSNRIINSIDKERSAELVEGKEEYLETKSTQIAKIILDEWTQDRKVAMNIHQYNFLYKRGAGEYAYNGILFLDKLLTKLENQVSGITYLASYEYGN